MTDSSPLIALASMGKLELLRERFADGVLVPMAVWREVVTEGAGRPGAEIVAAATWLSVTEVTTHALVASLTMELDNGEAEAIALFMERPCQAVLLDEADGRRVARRMGLPVLGTVGVLIWARQTGRIPSLAEALATIRERCGFRLHDEVHREALRAVGEWPG